MTVHPELQRCCRFAWWAIHACVVCFACAPPCPPPFPLTGAPLPLPPIPPARMTISFSSTPGNNGAIAFTQSTYAMFVDFMDKYNLGNPDSGVRGL